jgi:hypothetical protein
MFLLDHNRKMEKMWIRMQELVNNILARTPKAGGTQILEEPLETPAKAGTSGTTPKPAAGSSQVSPEEFNDFIGTPDLASLFSWSSMLLPSTETLRKWQSVMPEGLSPVTPITFRIPLKSPSPSHLRRTTSGKEVADMDISPSIKFHDPLQASVRASGASPPPQEPEPTFGQKGKEQALIVDQSKVSRSIDEETPRRRSLRKKS